MTHLSCSKVHWTKSQFSWIRISDVCFFSSSLLLLRNAHTHIAHIYNIKHSNVSNIWLTHWIGRTIEMVFVVVAFRCIKFTTLIVVHWIHFVCIWELKIQLESRIQTSKQMNKPNKHVQEWHRHKPKQYGSLILRKSIIEITSNMTLSMSFCSNQFVCKGWPSQDKWLRWMRFLVSKLLFF